MKKADRITALVSGMDHGPDTSDGPALDPHYLGYFQLFNEQKYYEAHDVLEHLWLRNKDADHAFFKGLIQLAGAFVHLQKQLAHPTHAKHATRLRPASRLFRLAMHNLEAYRPRHMQLDVDAVHALCEHHAREIVASGYRRNPLAGSPGLRLELGSGK